MAVVDRFSENCPSNRGQFYRLLSVRFQSMVPEIKWNFREGEKGREREQERKRKGKKKKRKKGGRKRREKLNHQLRLSSFDVTDCLSQFTNFFRHRQKRRAGQSL